MRQRRVFLAFISIGVLVLICGIVLHGIHGDLKRPEDRQRMERGTAVAVSGLVLLSLMVLVHKATSESTSYRE